MDTIKCPECGKEISGDFKFCPECGVKIPVAEIKDDTYQEELDKNDMDEEYLEEDSIMTSTVNNISKVEESKDFLFNHLYSLKRHKWISILIITVIIAVCIAGGTYKYRSFLNYDMGMDAIKAENYDQAIAYLQKSHEGRAEESLQFANTLRASEEDYNLGMKLYDDKEYEKSLFRLTSVNSNYPKYDKAKETMAECRSILSVNYLQEAKAYYSDKNYSDAYTAINKSLRYDSNLEEAVNLSQLYTEKYQEELDKIEKQREAEAKKAAEIAAAEEAKAVAAEKARKKSEGVRIGMTQQDVLDSSWGKPYDINKSTNAYGVSEQWCYNNYNYLYFEDGILTNIQN